MVDPTLEDEDFELEVALPEVLLLLDVREEDEVVVAEDDWLLVEVLLELVETFEGLEDRIDELEVKIVVYGGSVTALL